MADKKISQLTAATTPLAGTEVVPIVQSSSTVKVPVDDLTVKNLRSNATTGILQVAGPGAGTTRVMTTPNANFTAARTDAAQTFTGAQTFSADATFNGVRIGLGAGSVADNVVVGTDASPFITTGPRNVSMGWRGGYGLTSGSDNVSIGYTAGYGVTTGTQNTAVGADALQVASTTSQNTAVGYRALFVTTGAQSTAVGGRALAAATAGTNTALGYQAGDTITTGTSNVYVGLNADASANNVTNEIVVGPSITGKGSNTAFIGGTSGAYNGKNVTTWETTSDERIKKNIVDNHDGLDIIKQIRVRSFEYRKSEEITDLPAHAAIDKDGVQLGVIAQELRQVLPECVTENSTGTLSVSTDPLVWHLINAVKELSAKVEQLEARLGEG
jgi:hypothetical protein